MRSMRFSLWRSRFGAPGDEFLQVRSDLLDEGLQSPRRRAGGEQPTTDLALDLVDHQGAVDLPVRVRVRFRVMRAALVLLDKGVG